jgi:hypothetical protein
MIQKTAKLLPRSHAAVSRLPLTADDYYHDSDSDEAIDEPEGYNHNGL